MLTPLNYQPEPVSQPFDMHKGTLKESNNQNILITTQFLFYYLAGSAVEILATLLMLMRAPAYTHS